MFFLYYIMHLGVNYTLHNLFSALVAEWLRSLTTNQLPLTAVGSIRAIVFLSNEKAIQLSYEMSVYCARLCLK
jgi:hypothetical protein